MDLSYFRVDMPSLERLCRGCPKLATLSLPYSCDDDCVEAVFRGLTELRSLTLDLKNLTGRCLSLLPASLQRLRLQETLEDLDLAEIRRAARCPALTELDITDLYQPQSEILAELLIICPRLERLKAKEVDIADAFLKRLPELTPGIRDLDLAC